MNIVILDGYTANPGDLSWAGLEALGACTIYDRTRAGATVKRAAGAEIVLTNKTVLDKATIQDLPDLEYIGVLATGYNVVDLEAARDRDVVVSNVPAYSTDSVAQMALALLLELTNQVGYHAETVRHGRWAGCPDFCYWDRPLLELANLTLGVVGFGRIGQAVARRALAFGMQVLAYSRTRPADIPAGVRFVDDVDILFRESDCVSLHCPLTPETEALVNAERLRLMKKTAFLINTSRGPVIDEAALADALEAGEIAGAGLDVLQEEPPAANHPLLAMENCLITPHQAWASHAARRRLIDVAIENVKAFLDGAPQNVVS